MRCAARQPDEAVSTRTTLRKCGQSHPPELDFDGYERLKRMPDAAGSCPTLRYDAGPEHHRGEIFSPLLSLSRSQLDRDPRRPLLVSTTANQTERPFLLRPQTPTADMARMTQ